MFILPCIWAQWGLYKIIDILKTNCLNAFSWQKNLLFLLKLLKFIHKAIIQMVQVMAWHVSSTEPMLIHLTGAYTGLQDLIS